MRGFVLAVLALAACSQRPQAPTAEAQVVTAAPAGCTAQTSRDWSAVGSQYYVIEAEARGESCADAKATIRIETRDGVLLFQHEYDVADVPLAFNPDDDQTGLRSDLEGWTQNTSETQTADWLPAWPAGANRPPNFQPAVTRGQYEGARGAQGPLFCYPDSAESNACVAMDGDHATLLGSLTPEAE